MGKTLLIVLAVLVVIGGIIALSLSGIFNRLVTLQQATDAAWAQVQNVYQRRADLIPNLVNTVAGAANFEKSTLTEVTEARASVGRVQLPANGAPTDAAKLAEFERAQGQLSSALSRLLVVSERYPDLKATAGFRDLQAQLEGTENRITVARNRYIASVQDYNVSVRQFPSNLTAKLFGYDAKPNFSVENEAEISKPPKVDFGR
jgi:LemA protein